MSLDIMIPRLVVGSSADGVRALYNGILEGRISSNSTVNEVLVKVRPHSIPIHLLHDVISAWRSEEAYGMTSYAMAKALGACLNCCQQIKHEKPDPEIVWTGPVATSGGIVRSTWSVFLDMIESARQHLLLVGYNLTVQTNTTETILKSLAQAKRNGCHVTMALHDNGINVTQLLRAWPEELAIPRMLKWKGRQNDQLASLHAKLLVIDRQDLLVTSANLSYHGMESNMELGVRIRGEQASQVVRHFQALEREGILEPYY